MAWIECVPNISEGRRKPVIEKIAEAIRSVPGTDLRSISSDPDHNRTVYTFAGTPPSVLEAAFRCVRTARDLIDVTKHEGVHPRLGAADVVPLVPLAGTKLSWCGRWARELAGRIESELEIPAYRYGAASDEGETLPAIRKRANKRHPTAGAVAVGAREVLIAYNVQLASKDVELAKSIARQIRESDGGLPGVQALGFPLASRDCVQVSMNLLDYRRTSPLRAYRRIRQLAKEAGVEVESSEVVGMIPRDAITRSFRASVRSGPLEILDPEPGFIDRVASRAPTPAAGSAAAHTGALAAALVVMSCDCSRPTPRLRELRLKAERLRDGLTRLIEADSQAFRSVLDGGGEEALKLATDVPVQICELSSQLWAIAALAAHHCDKKVSSDCAGGRRLAEAARDIAAETARANLPLISDGSFRSQIARRLAAAFSG